MKHALAAGLTTAALFALPVLTPVNANAGAVSPAAAANSWGPWQSVLRTFSRLPRVRYRGEHPTHRVVLRNHHTTGLINYPTQVQHIVVIYMENRSVDNLFSGLYYSPYPGGGTWGSQLTLCQYDQPSGCGGYGPLTKYELYGDRTAGIDPGHLRVSSFWQEAKGNWGGELFGCPDISGAGSCSGKVFAYVDPTEMANYAALVTGVNNNGQSSGEFASNMLQANEGPSWVSHQYLIAGQSGGYSDGATAPNAQAENPSTPKGGYTDPEPTTDYSTAGTYPDEELSDTSIVGCGSAPNAHPERVLDMQLNYAPARNAEYAGMPTPMPQACDDYPTLQDEVAAQFKQTPMAANYQYIFHSTNSIWAAPLGVQHLYNAWAAESGTTHGPQDPSGIEIDPDAEAFVNLTLTGKGTLPFAPLTVITPCMGSSDHPNPQKLDDGPMWLPWLVNAIGSSKYWPSTVIFITWDDWGGWFDSYNYLTGIPLPYHPNPNPYNMAQDANEWGFRVPFIVVSPFITKPGYVSSLSQLGFVRSQGAITSAIEDMFALPTLGADDLTNQANNGDVLQDMIHMGAGTTPYRPVPVGSYQPTCSK